MIAAFSGCERHVELIRETERIEQKVAELRDVRAAATSSRQFSRLRVVDGPYTGIVPAPAIAHLIPTQFLADDGVTLPVAGVVDTAVLAARIEVATGLRVRFVGAALDPETEQAALSNGMFGLSAVDALAPVGGIWTGSLVDLLDGWVNAGGYSWRYDGDSETIEIIRSRTVIFQINALGGNQRYRVTSSTQDLTGESGTSNLAQQEIASEMEYAPWQAIEEQLKGLVGEGATLSFSASSGSVVVQGSPREIERVRGYLAYLNRVVLRPVNLSVHVYSVSLEQESDYQLGLNLLLQDLLGKSDLAFEIASNTVSIVKAGSEPLPRNTLMATVRALQRTGTVSRVLSAEVPSLNGAPAQFFELLREGYLKELRVTSNEGVVQTELRPGTISSGFALSYVPRITGPDEVLVRLISSLQDRPIFREFSSAEQTIQLPVYGSRAIQVVQRIRRGETLVVTGFTNNGVRAERGGTFAVDIPLPEGHRRGETTRIEQVLLVTADIGAPLGISEVWGTNL